MPEAPDLGRDSELERWARAFEEELDWLYWNLRRYGVSETDAQDLAQDVFLVMWRRRAEYQADRPLRPWLAGIAFRVAYRHLHDHRRDSGEVSAELPDLRPQPDEVLAASRERALVSRALASLRDRHRAALVAHDIEGIPMRELAALWSVPVFTAYTRVRVARQAFARAVHRLQGERPAPAIDAAATLASEREPRPAPAGRRARMRDRLRALLTIPPVHWPRPFDQAMRGGGSRMVPWALVTATVLVGALGLLVRAPLRGRALLGRVAPATPKACAASSPSRARFEPPARGLVGHWRFDAGTGSSQARDASGRGNDCVLHDLDPGRAWGPGVWARGIDLGRRGWLTCDQPARRLGDGEELTWAAWVRPRAFRANHHTILAWPTTDGRDGVLLRLVDNEVVLFSDPVHGWTSQALEGPPRWIHLALTHVAGGAVRLFVDGREASAGRVRFVRPAQLGAFVVGQRAPIAGQPPSPSQHFEGAVDEVLLYDRALAPEELRALARR